jgi:hypothetical protein
MPDRLNSKGPHAELKTFFFYYLFLFHSSGPTSFPGVVNVVWWARYQRSDEVSRKVHQTQSMGGILFR